MTEPMSDEPAVRDLVEQFLAAAGRYDLDAIERLLAPNANVGLASRRGGEWVTATMTATDWLDEGRAESDPAHYLEPVDDWTIHIDAGRLAFVRADATLSVEGRPERHNIDYFVLIKQDGAWKFLTLSYVGRPADHS